MPYDGQTICIHLIILRKDEGHRRGQPEPPAPASNADGGCGVRYLLTVAEPSLARCVQSRMLCALAVPSPQEPTSLPNKQFRVPPSAALGTYYSKTSYQYKPRRRIATNYRSWGPIRRRGAFGVPIVPIEAEEDRVVGRRAAEARQRAVGAVYRRRGRHGGILLGESRGVGLPQGRWRR